MDTSDHWGDENRGLFAKMGTLGWQRLGGRQKEREKVSYFKELSRLARLLSIGQARCLETEAEFLL